MTREFPDELLSAYLDGELTAAEHQQVEARLAASDADRQLLAELRSLRGEVASLPRHQVDSNFADRVVRAALAAQSADVPPPLEVSLPASRSRARWIYAAAVLAAAASLLVAIQPWRSTSINSTSSNSVVVAANPAQQLIDTLRSAAPSEGQALVARLQVPAGAAGAFEAALTQVGIATAAVSSANPIADAYRQQVGERLAAGSPAAAAAVLVEAPLADIERALAAVVDAAPRGVSLVPETKLDWTKLATSAQATGEPGSGSVIQPGQSLALRLDAGQFPLGTAVTPITGIPTPPVAAGPVRVIILVEPTGAR